MRCTVKAVSVCLRGLLISSVVVFSAYAEVKHSKKDEPQEIVNDACHASYYIVRYGDTLYSLANSRGFSVESLTALNLSCGVVFKKDSIKVGQKIFLPIISGVQRHELPNITAEGPTSLISRVGLTAEKVEGFIANESSRLGNKYSDLSSQKIEVDGAGLQSREKEGDYWKSKAISEATQLVNDSVNEFVANQATRIGTAKTNVKIDERMKVTSISADLLMPISKTEKKLAFVQGGIRHKGQGSRLIANIGIGQRYFSNEQMFGYNAFFDRDVSRKHNRLGLGGEAWGDYYKTNVNLYAPISGWKESPNIKNHLEKAAYGADIQATAYLPSYPQLGFNSKLEKYFGEKVDLLSNGQLVESPHALTLGLEYTPIPLVTVKAGQVNTKGQGSSADISLQMNWNLGKSFDEMLDSSKVAASRKLSGMAMDLVERNNDIVLQYKEVDTFNIKLPDQISVLELSSFVLEPEIIGDAKGLSYTWEGELLQTIAIDNLVQHDRQLKIERMPPFDRMGGNDYYLTLRVTDHKGQTKSAMTHVIVQENSSLVPHVRLKDKSVVLAKHTVYEIDWSIFDPRNPSCQPCGVENLDYEVALVVDDSLRPYMQGRKVIAAGEALKPAVVKISVVTPGGFQIEDSMSVAIADEENGKLTLLAIKLFNLDGTPYTDPVLRVGKVKLIPHVEFQGVIAAGVIGHQFHWERKSVNHDGDWEKIADSQGDEYVTSARDQGYVFRLVASVEA
ncbi:inverse autotransporter beta domain-containing protein [Aeromonas sp. S12(2024)]|uniref:inverse autotransporter beta domain-containing protein n=1 Tax=Aeromonas sp. S12(2024) TaxID=3242885 RepID=UPI003528C81B